MHSHTHLSPTTFLERSGRAFPNRTAIIGPNGIVTYGELLQRSRRLAQVLRRLQLQPGDRVALITENGQETIECSFGIPSIGAILVALNPWLNDDELRSLLSYCEAKVLIMDASLNKKISSGAYGGLSCLQQVIIIGESPNQICSGSINYEDCIAEENGDFELNCTIQSELAPLSINFTSGTTGQPKGVLCDHRGVYLNAIGQVLMLGLNRASKYLWLLPMFHVNGWGHIWASVAVGATQIIPSRNQDESLDLVEILAQHQITHLCGSPRAIRSLAESIDDKKMLWGLTITTGGAAPAPSLLLQLEKVGINVIHQYGLNETCGPYVVCEDAEEWQLLTPEDRSIKRARQGVAAIHAGTGLRVVDSSMQDVPWNGSSLGEVIVAGNTVATSYYKNPEATEKAFRNGWFHTGDMAVLHPDGYLEIRDRLKDLIYVETDYGWENISSTEIEGILLQHDGVEDSAVIGLSSEDLGKNFTLLVAFVQTVRSPSVIEDDLRVFCKSVLAPYKQPQLFFFMDLPKTPTGKIKKNMLVAEALARLKLIELKFLV
jgi:fatty-acyl-CoA synthase